MREIISHLASHGLPPGKLIMIPPPPSDIDQCRRRGIKSKDNALTRLFYDASRRLAEEVGAAVALDFWDALLERPNMFADGVHFSRQGSEVVFRSLLPHVDKLVPKKKFH